MKKTTAALQPGVYYHIYNRENLFIENRNYPYFLTLYEKHIEPEVCSRNDLVVYR